jgi:hypothetical protein
VLQLKGASVLESTESSAFGVSGGRKWPRLLWPFVPCHPGPWKWPLEQDFWRRGRMNETRFNKVCHELLVWSEM